MLVGHCARRRGRSQAIGNPARLRRDPATRVSAKHRQRTSGRPITHVAIPERPRFDSGREADSRTGRMNRRASPHASAFGFDLGRVSDSRTSSIGCDGRQRFGACPFGAWCSRVVFAWCSRVVFARGVPRVGSGGVRRGVPRGARTFIHSSERMPTYCGRGVRVPERSCSEHEVHGVIDVAR